MERKLMQEMGCTFNAAAVSALLRGQREYVIERVGEEHDGQQAVCRLSMQELLNGERMLMLDVKTYEFHEGK